MCSTKGVNQASAISPDPYIKLVRDEARRVHRRTRGGVELDELVSMGVEGLFDAIARFDAGRSVPFGAYARLRIRGRIYDSLGSVVGLPRRFWRNVRVRKRPIHRVSLDEALVGNRTTCDGPPEWLRGAIAEGVDGARAARALGLLEPQDAELLRSLYLEGRTLSEAGALLGRSPSWVSRKRDRALVILRERLAWEIELSRSGKSAA